ncbi:hypothetical protein B4U80_14459, partial [Leptotrombidium deliense]
YCAPERFTGECLPNGIRCKVHDDCCDKNCVRYYEYNIIICARVNMSDDSNECIIIDEKCESDEQCCSNNCVDFYKFGVKLCRPLYATDECLPNRIACKKNDDCCSNNCVNYKEYGIIVCRPSIAILNFEMSSRLNELNGILMKANFDCLLHLVEKY